MCGRAVLLIVCLAAYFTLGWCAPAPAEAADLPGAPCPAVRPIHFAPGARSVVLSGGVARGESDCLSVSAKAGQRTSLALHSVEANAVLQFYQPGWKVSRTDDGVQIAGRAYAGVAESDDATRWTGVLAETGAQLLVIGSSRGSAAYRLTITIGP